MLCEGVKNMEFPPESHLFSLSPSFIVLMRWDGAAGKASCDWQTVSAQRRYFSLVCCGLVKPYLLSEKHSLDIS